MSSHQDQMGRICPSNYHVLSKDKIVLKTEINEGPAMMDYKIVTLLNSQYFYISFHRTILQQSFAIVSPSRLHGPIKCSRFVRFNKNYKIVTWHFSRGIISIIVIITNWYGMEGGLHSTEEAFLIPTQQPRVYIPALPRFFLVTS